MAANAVHAHYAHVYACRCIYFRTKDRKKCGWKRNIGPSKTPIIMDRLDNVLLNVALAPCINKAISGHNIQICRSMFSKRGDFNFCFNSEEMGVRCRIQMRISVSLKSSASIMGRYKPFWVNEREYTAILVTPHSYILVKAYMRYLVVNTSLINVSYILPE